MASTLMLNVTLDGVRRLMSGHSGDLQARLNPDAECCMLHTAVMPVVLASGCGKEALGSHAAIRALRNHGSHLCLAEVGQRVLDRRCVAIALGQAVPKSMMQGVRSPSFLRKFSGGFPFLPLVYGRGYCYLWLFLPTARSRTARVLGQYPLLVDVLKFWAVLGVWDSSYHVSVTRIGCGVYHVARVSIGKTVPEAIAYLLAALSYEMNARVGGTPEFHPANVVEGMLLGAPVVRPLGVCVDQRFDMIKSWFFGRGFELSDQCAEEVWLVTRAAMHFGPNETVSKKFLSMAEHLGDRVLAMIMSMRCLSAMLTPAECSAYSAQFKNDVLADFLNVSGLRDVCEVSGLAVTSKGNANILESVIGVLATHYSYNRLLSFVEDLGVKFPASSTVVVRDVEIEVAGLTSLQYQRALALVAQGKI